MKEIIELYIKLFNKKHIGGEDNEITDIINQIASRDNRITPELLLFVMRKVSIDCRINQANDEIQRIRRAYGYSGCVSKEEMGRSSLRLELQPYKHDLENSKKIQREHLKGKSKMFKLVYELKREKGNNKIK